MLVIIRVQNGKSTHLTFRGQQTGSGNRNSLSQCLWRPSDSFCLCTILLIYQMSPLGFPLDLEG